MERQAELYQERQWDLYRHSVAEEMPDSEYKTAVLAGIAHALSRLDSIESSRCGLTVGRGAPDPVAMLEQSTSTTRNRVVGLKV